MPTQFERYKQRIAAYDEDAAKRAAMKEAIYPQGRRTAYYRTEPARPKIYFCSHCGERYYRNDDGYEIGHTPFCGDSKKQT